jgi:cell division protease FtsH
MVTKFGMSDKFDMMSLETTNNSYLGGDSSLCVSAETASEIDSEVLEIIKTCHAKAREILEENKEKMHDLTKYLYEKETITGEQFMEMLAQ